MITHAQFSNAVLMFKKSMKSKKISLDMRDKMFVDLLTMYGMMQGDEQEKKNADFLFKRVSFDWRKQKEKEEK